MFALNIFPEGALASSVVTTVWIGIFFVVYFNLRLGWVLSGLVVPGYIVPLLLVKPMSAGIVFAEGIITYCIVWIYSEYISRFCGWSNLFGRDRFFALVLVSVAVRIISDSWLLPALGEYLTSHHSLIFDYRNNLHSFGLIIIALIANNFWKTGLPRGLWQMIITTGLTYAVVRYGLMEYTNFSISNLSYMYEDMSSSILASPKAYIIVITTAFIASRMNLLYGWDFAGILIPSLLALQWYEPWKILASFVEAIVILQLAIQVLKIPIFKNTTMEGARKLLLFFNVSFAYKMVLAYALLYTYPAAKISDFYGFGYLLATLMALKMHDKGIFARLSRSILQVSFVSAGVATIIGFGLTLLTGSIHFKEDTIAQKSVAVIKKSNQSLIELLRNEKLAIYKTRIQHSMTPPSLAETAAFSQGLTLLMQYASNHDSNLLTKAQVQLGKASYQVIQVEDRYLMLKEKAPYHHAGIYVINMQAKNNLALEVPAPAEERNTLDAGAWLFSLFEAKTLAIAGSARQANADNSSDVLTAPQTLYQAFHQQVALDNVLQIRRYVGESTRALTGDRRDTATITAADPPTTLMVKQALPVGLQLEQLKELTDTFNVIWGNTPFTNLQRDATNHHFAELIFSREDIRKLLARSQYANQSLDVTKQAQSIEGYLQDWLLDKNKKRIAPAGSNLYIAPQMEEMLFFDDEVVTPLLESIKLHYQNHAWDATGLENLKLIRAAAQSAGYNLTQYHHQGTGVDYLILAEKDDVKVRTYRGTFVFRLGAKGSAIIQVPRPLYDINSIEFSVALFERLQASALLLGGAHPNANQDLSADLTRLSNKESLFNLVNQSLLRVAPPGAWVIQCRTMGRRADVPNLTDADVLLSVRSGISNEKALDANGQQLAAALTGYGLNWRFAQGSLEEAGYDAQSSPQASAMNTSLGKTFSTLWLSPLMRSWLRQQTEWTPQQAQFMALNIPTLETDLYQYLLQHKQEPTVSLPPAFFTKLRPYLISQDIVQLSAMQQQFKQLRWLRLIDISSRQGFLVVLDATENGVLGVFNLTARNVDSRVEYQPNKPDRETVAQFVESRTAWLRRKD